MKRSVIIAAFLSAGLLAGAGAWAQNPPALPDKAAPKEPKEQPKANLKPISEVIAQIGRITPGRSQDTQTVTQPGGTIVYQIQWVTNADNRRITYVVDAQTGRILSPQGR